MNQTIEMLEPVTRKFVENVNKQGGTPIYKLSPKDARKVLSDLQASEVAKLPADVEDLNIPAGPDGQVSIRIIRPKGNKEVLPVVMYFHGGGWVLGDKGTHDRLVREIANGAGAAVIFVNFTLSPEAQYPEPIEEAYAATKYIAENGKNLNLDSSRLAVAGDSVGGNMAAAVMLLAKEREGPKIDYQVLFYPVTDANFDTASYKQFASDIWLTREAMKWFWDYHNQKANHIYPICLLFSMGRSEKLLGTYKVRLEAVYEDNSHPPDNLTLISRFLRRESHKGLSDETLKENYWVFTIFSRWCVLPIPELIEDDIYDFLDFLKDHTYTRNGKECHYSDVTIHSYKNTLKKFFRAQGRPELIEALSGKTKYNKTIERAELLDKQDIEALLSHAMNSRDRAIIAVLYEAGPRRGELLAVRIKHIEFDINGLKLTLPEGKTGPRTIRLVFSASYIRAWLQDHPAKNQDGKLDQDAYLFSTIKPVTENGKLFYGQLSEMTLYKQLQKIAKRAGITKRVNPHSFRHARATELAEHLTEQQMKKFLGWTPDSKMCSVYVHDPDTEQAILKQYGLKIEDTYTDGLRVGRCPWCKELNPETYSFCGVCGRPLTQNALNEIQQKEKEIQAVLALYQLMATKGIGVEEIQEQVKRKTKEEH